MQLFSFLTFLAFAIVPSVSSNNVLDPADYTAIQQTINAYPLAIDSKNFDGLSNVFTQDVIANYSAPINVLKGLDAVKTALSASLALVTTQHALSTHHLTFNSPNNVSSIVYYRAVHFGMGVYANETVTAWGNYQDELTKLADGEWRVRKRQLVYMGPILGNLSIFTPQ